MKLPVFLIVSALTLTSCTSVNTKNIEGVWLDKEKEMFTLKIDNSDGNYQIVFQDGSFPLQKTDLGYKFRKGKIDYVISYNKKKNLLSVNEKEYIRENKGKKYLFTGIWYNRKEEGRFKKIDMKEQNRGFWIVTKSDGSEASFYPKLTDDGYTFSYGNEQLFFKRVDDYIVDSEGIKYYRNN